MADPPSGDSGETGTDPEKRALRRFGNSEAIASVLNSVVKWGGLVLIARYGYLSVEALAGQATIADIGVGVDLFSGVELSHIVAWVFATLGVGLGIKQRNLRRDTVERLQGRIREMERTVNPGRTSSNLTPRGETRPEDEL